MLVSSPTRLLIFLLFQPPYRSLSERDNTRILLNNQKQPDIGQEHQEESDKVEDEEGDGSAGLLTPMEKVVHCERVSVSGRSSESEQPYGNSTSPVGPD